MLPYLLCFFCSCFLIWIAEYILSRYKRKDIFIIISIIAILVVSILAGIRNPNIGTDVQVYAKPIFDIAKNSRNFVDYQFTTYSKNYYTITAIAETEIGFTLLAYICAKITGSFVVFLLIIHIIICGFVYIGLYHNRTKLPIWLGMLSFYLIFYNESLNMMRQSMAMSIMFFALNYLLNKKYLKYFLWTLIAMLFHQSAIIGIAILILHYIICHREIKKWKIAFISISMLLIIMFWREIIIILSSWNVIPKRFSYYVGVNQKVSFSLSATLWRLPFLLLCLFNTKKLRNKDSNFLFLFLLMILDLIFVQLQTIRIYAYRLSVYFAYSKLLVLPELISCQKLKYKKRILKLIIIILLFIYWYYNMVIEGRNETIPYLTIWSY